MSGLNYTTATWKIIDTLGKDPDNSFHTREVAEDAGVSIGAASMILRSLEGQHVVTSIVKENMKFYRIDLTNPVARQFKVLYHVDKLTPLVDELKGYADRIILFGKCADGLDGRENDVDLFILTIDARSVREQINRFERGIRFYRHLSPIIMNAEEFAHLRRRDSSLYGEIARGRILWPWK